MRIRGRYFSARQRMTMISGIVAGVVMSWLLDHFTADGSLAGYTIVFILAGIFGAGDIACFFWVSWPPMPENCLMPMDSELTCPLKSTWRQELMATTLGFWQITAGFRT